MQQLVHGMRAYKYCSMSKATSARRMYEHICSTCGQPCDLNIVGVTAKRLDVVANPEQREPLVLEPEVPVDLRFVTGEESEHREPIAYVDPDLATLC